MGLLTTLKKPVPDRDRVVIYADNGTADIATVYDSDEQALYASSPNQDYAIPISDVKAHVGPGGRIYHIGATADYVSDTIRLAALEKSMVLRQITQYSKPVEALKGGLNIQKILLYVLIGVLLLAVIFK